MQPQPRIAYLERIAINRPRFALQQHRIHALSFSGRRSNANRKQRNGECSVLSSHFRTSDPVHNETRQSRLGLFEQFWCVS